MTDTKWALPENVSGATGRNSPKTQEPTLSAAQARATGAEVSPTPRAVELNPDGSILGTEVYAKGLHCE